MRSIDDEIKTRFANNKQRFITNLIFTSNWFQNQFVEFLKPFKISQQQFNILRILRGAGKPLTMNDIKELMIDKFPNTTRISNKMIEKGLIKRERSENDRRIVYLSITKQGLELLEEIDKDNTTKHLACLDKLSDAEAKEFSHLLDKMRA